MDVAELVANHAAKFILAHDLEEPGGHRHGGMPASAARGEGVRRSVPDDVDRRLGEPCAGGQLLDRAVQLGVGGDRGRLGSGDAKNHCLTTKEPVGRRQQGDHPQPDRYWEDSPAAGDHIADDAAGGTPDPEKREKERRTLDLVDERLVSHAREPCRGARRNV